MAPRVKAKEFEPPAALIPMLELAVPLWIDRIRQEAWSEEHRLGRAKVCAQVVAEKGDVLQFGSKTKGEAANVFNRLAEGLACAAYQPGGVKFAGLVFEASDCHPTSD